jgi:conjugal transfer pilus assembly protein TraD
LADVLAEFGTGRASLFCAPGETKVPGLKGFKYEYAQRPNYEMRAFVGWLAGGLLIWIVMSIWGSGLPASVYGVMGMICSGFAVVRGLQATMRFRVDQRLKEDDKALWKVYWEAIKKKVKRNAKQVWLGEGFLWGQGEIQKATDIMNTEKAEFFQENKNWIHGLAKSRNFEIPIEALEGHTLVVGSTGTGKTRLFDLLISQAIFRGERVIVIDPKGDPDLRTKMQLACERIGARDRFVYFHPAMPHGSVRIDPLKNWSDHTEIASRVADLIPSETENVVFTNFCWQAMNWIVEGLIYTDRRPNLLQLDRYINEGVKEILWAALRKYFGSNFPGTTMKSKLEDLIKQYQQMVQKDEKNRVKAIDGLLTSHFHNSEHFQKMVVSLVPLLSMLTSGELKYLLSPKPTDGDPRPVLDLASLIEKNAVFYVGLNSLANEKVGGAIGSILLADLTAAAGAIYNRGQQGDGRFRPDPVNIFIDEAAEVVNDPAIQVLNKGRGAGFRVVIATQTLADLEVRTGSKAGARQVIGNTNTWIMFRVIDCETQEYLAKALPKTAVKGVDMGYRSGSKSDDPSQFSSMYTESLREKPTELFPPALLGQLQKFHFFCRFSEQTWKGKLPIIEYEK